MLSTRYLILYVIFGYALSFQAQAQLMAMVCYSYPYLYQGDKIVDYFDWMNEDTEFVHQFYFDESKKAIGNSIGFDMLKNKVYRGDKYGKYHSRRDSGKIGLGFSYRMVRLERRDVRLKGSIVLGYGLEKSFDRDYDFSRDAHQDKLHAFGPYQIPGTEHSFKLEIECHDTNMPK